MCVPEKVGLSELMFKEEQCGSGSWRGEEGIKEHRPSGGEAVIKIITQVTYLTVPTHKHALRGTILQTL